MKVVRSFAFSVVLAGASAFAVACGGTVEHSPQTSASALTKAPVGTTTHGVIKVVGDALGDVALRPEQRTEIEKLAQDAETRHAPIAEHRKALMLAFADQLESGTIDKTTLQPKLDQATSDIDKIGVQDRGALVKLHDLLDAEQRNAFVDALEKQMKAKRGEHGDHGPSALAGFGKLKQLADDLKLTEAQRSQIHDVMREGFKEGMKHGGPGGEAHHGPPPGGRGHHPPFGDHGGKKVLEAFRQDKLDLDLIVPPHAAQSMMTFGAGHVIGLAEKVVPILTPEQRKIAADKVRAAAAGGDALLFP